MRWKNRRKSTNVEDRRGQRVGYGAAAAAPALLKFLPALFKTKTGRIILVVGVVVFFGSRLMGIDLLPLLLGGITSCHSCRLPRSHQPGGPGRLSRSP